MSAHDALVEKHARRLYVDFILGHTEFEVTWDEEMEPYRELWRSRARDHISDLLAATFDRPCETCYPHGDVLVNAGIDSPGRPYIAPCPVCGGSGSIPVSAVVHALSDSQLREAVERAKEVGILMHEQPCRYGRTPDDQLECLTAAEIWSIR